MNTKDINFVKKIKYNSTTIHFSKMDNVHLLCIKAKPNMIQFSILFLRRVYCTLVYK